MLVPRSNATASGTWRRTGAIPKIASKAPPAATTHDPVPSHACHAPAQVSSVGRVDAALERERLGVCEKRRQDERARENGNRNREPRGALQFRRSIDATFGQRLRDRDDDRRADETRGRKMEPDRERRRQNGQHPDSGVASGSGQESMRREDGDPGQQQSDRVGARDS
jgi:hypothetical protein